jgi:hypothetical protein
LFFPRCVGKCHKNHWRVLECGLQQNKIITGSKNVAVTIQNQHKTFNKKVIKTLFVPCLEDKKIEKHCCVTEVLEVNKLIEKPISL